MLGDRGEDLRTPVVILVCGVIGTLFVYLLESRFGIWGLIVVLVLFYLYETQISGRLEGPR